MTAVADRPLRPPVVAAGDPPPAFDPVAALAASVDGLHDAHSELSARTVFRPGQRPVIVLAVLLIVLAAVVAPIGTVQVLMAVTTLLYAAALAYRIILFRLGMHSGTLVAVTDAEAAETPDADLPVYTVLVPAYREPEVISRLVGALAALRYPPDRLDVKLLLEVDDLDTIDAARRSLPSEHVELVLVPAGGPRTKPKACNYGLVSARGELVTIYDAEDHPDPWQLRRAVVALARLGSGYACVQARLGYFNSRQNLITRWFTVEYGSWFRFLLPGLTAAGAPVPLGGTSNHFRTSVLRAVGAWDPYNVTEDADLGIRLARLGYRVGVLDSVTEEEANSDFVNWVKQRSRWYKGYLITWLVHLRDPLRLLREIGVRGVVGLNLFIAGTPLTTVMNPVFWTLVVIWYAEHPRWLAQVFIAPVFYLAMASFVLGNAAVIYTNVVTTRWIGRPDLVWAALTSPGYWVMMSLAATKAVAQLVVRPSFWEKTAHGLDAPTPAAGTMPAPPPATARPS